MDGKRKRGRPVKDQNDVKRHKLLVRMNDKEWAELTELSERAGLSMSECMRLSVRYQKQRFPKVNYYKEKKE